MKSKYENMSFDELRAECVRRGFLDEKGKHVYKKRNIKSDYSYELLCKRTGFSYDEAQALLDLAMESDESELKQRVLSLARKEGL